MAQEYTLQAVKDSLRVRHDRLDDDIMASIDAALADLRMCGISAREEEPLVLNAIKLRVRAEYCDSTTDAAAFMSRYDAMKTSMQIAEGYADEA